MAVYIDALGDASVIRDGELPDPVAGAGQVLVCVEAVAVNNVDTYLRNSPPQRSGSTKRTLSKPCQCPWERS